MVGDLKSQVLDFYVLDSMLNLSEQLNHVVEWSIIPYSVR